MKKFDKSSGLSNKEIGAIKYNIKNEISRKLPELPDPVETKLFLQGRSAWKKVPEGLFINHLHPALVASLWQSVPRIIRVGGYTVTTLPMTVVPR